MSTGAAGRVVVLAGLGYVALLGWSIGNLSYDIWGALVLVPVYGALGIAAMRAMFRRPYRRLAPIMCWGLLIKLGGACARYWVGFEAYGGGIDAGAYGQYGTEKAALIRSGEVPVFEAVPTGIGTEFVENFTAFVYTISGSSLLGGFVTFSFLAYLGLAFFVKAAAIAVPRFARRKYAWLCVLFPSLVYWPSSIGKEALMMLGLGIATYGFAMMFSAHRWFRSLLLVAVGLGFAGLIRPHMAGIWIAGALPALVIALLRDSSRPHRRRVSRTGLVLVVAIASVGLWVLASATIRFLEPDQTSEEGGSSLTQIFEETTRRTQQAGSQFTPPTVSGPVDWPFAVVRTLTRPLPIEANGVAQLASAAEMTALLGLYVVSWRRVRRLPHLLVSNRYVAFAMTVLFLTGLAFSVFANLGVLTRQKSLVVPFLLLIACLPMTASERDDGAARASGLGREDDARAASAGDPGVVPARPSRTAVPTRAERPPVDQAVIDDIWDERERSTAPARVRAPVDTTDLWD